MNVFRMSALAMGVSLAMSGCGGGGGSSSGDSPTVARGFTLPSEISAVPSDSGSVAASVRSLGATAPFSRAVSALSVSSDYHSTTTQKFVEERALEQFDIIEQVLSAVGQTNYAEPAVINQGAYTAIVAWIDNQDGREVKTLQPWVVDSSMIKIDGADVNRVQAWIEEPDWDNPGQTRIIKAEFMIYQAASVNADGSFADYGVWDLNVSFDPSATSYFAASSTISGGVNTIKVHEVDMGGQGAEMKGVLVRSGVSGYGKVAYPDWDWCWQNATGPGCTPPTKTAQYVYDTDYLVVDGDVNINGTNDAVFKDRNPADAVEFALRYGLFYNETPPSGITAGDDIKKHKTFGFPIVYEATFPGSTETVQDYAYYGAWQGRHELWGGGQSGISEGTVVTRDDQGAGQISQTYVASAKFNGTFTKRMLVNGDLSDIQDIAVETWVNKHYVLFWDSAQNGGTGDWMFCDGEMKWSESTPGSGVWTENCVDFLGNTIAKQSFNDYGSLELSDSDRKWVSIGGGWDNINNTPIEYKYLSSDPSITGFVFAGAGFYRASRVQGNEGEILELNVPAEEVNPTDGESLWVDIGGSIYIQYTGQFSGPVTTTGWVQKRLLSFEEQTQTPTFADDAQDGSAAFQPDVGREYYINNNGANVIVMRKDAANAAASYEVKIELQSTANPVNIASFVPATVDYFRTPWRPEVRLEFVSASGSNFLKLVYATDDPSTPSNEIGTVYTSGEWGLQAYDDNGTPTDYSDDKPLVINSDGTTTAISVDQYGFPDPSVYTTQQAKDAARPTEFNWEYSENGWGTQQFLCTPDCSSISNYVVLADPVQLNPLVITNGAGASKTLSLQFDGWMHGLPDLYRELAKNDYQMSQAIADKVINIPAGTEVTDSEGVTYYIKPLEISVFLAEVANTTPNVPDISVADGVDLNSVPTFTDHGMGNVPADTDVLYSEGVSVSSN